MKASKIIYALLSALMLAGAITPAISTLAATEEPITVVKADDKESSVLSSTNYTKSELPVGGLGQAGYVGNDSGLSDQELLKVVSDIDFYFHKVGYVDSEGHYVINNVELLKERALTGDFDAQTLLEVYEQQMTGEGEKVSVAWLTCVAINSIPGVSGVATISSMIKAYAKKNMNLFTSASSAWALAKALGVMFTKFGMGFDPLGIVANVIVAMASC